MGERLDLSGFQPTPEGYYNSHTDSWEDRELLNEALRAQASEDALKERVRVLEYYLRDLCDGLHANTPFWSEVRNALTGGKGK